MRRIHAAALVAVFLAPSMVRADEAASAVVDKAIKAMGGEEMLAKSGTATWKAKGKITFGDNTNDLESTSTAKGLDYFRSEFEGEFNKNAIKGVMVLADDKGWRKFGDDVTPLEGEMLANQKRTVYIQIVPMTLVPLKGERFKIEAAGEEKVDDKPAAAVKVTGPDGKDFKLLFDRESGLPVRLVATVPGFQGDEFTQETTFRDFKEFAGVKRATKVVSKRDGQDFLDQTITEFKPLDKVEADTFAEPK